MRSSLAIVGRVLRFFPAVLLAFVVVAFSLALSEFLTETTQELLTVQSTVTGGRK